jgi:hypothetical protein
LTETRKEFKTGPPGAVLRVSLELEDNSVMLGSDSDGPRSPCRINIFGSDMVGPCVLLTRSILLAISIRVKSDLGAATGIILQNDSAALL